MPSYFCIEANLVKIFMIYRLYIYIFILSFLYSKELKNFNGYEEFMMAEYEMLNDNYITAEKYYEKAIQLSPDSPTILQTIANYKIYKGDYLDAINHLEQIQKLGLLKKQTGIKLYDLYKKINLDIKAGILLESLRMKFSNDMDILSIYADLYYDSKEWDSLLSIYSDIYKLNLEQDGIIIKIYEIGIATDNLDLVKMILLDLKSISNSQTILSFLVEISEQQGDIPEAISFMEEWIFNYGSNDESNIKLSLFYLRVKEFQQVLDILSPIFNSGNYSLELLRIYLIANSELGNYKEELLISKVIIDEYANNPLGYESLSISYLQLNLLDEAVKILLLAVEKFPNEIGFYFSLGTIFYSMGEFSNSEKYLYQALKIQPNYIPAKHTLAMLYEDMNNLNLADSLFYNIISENEDNSMWKNDYAYILSEREDYSQERLDYALGIAQKAVDMEPDNAAFLDTIGWVNYKLGFYQVAKAYLEKSLKINDDNPVILEHMGDIYTKINRFSDALTLYEKILDLDSENQNIKNKINKINE